MEVGCCAATRCQNKLTDKKQQHQMLMDILDRITNEVHRLPVPSGNAGEILQSTLPDTKLTGADADEVDRLTSRLGFHAQKTLHSIVQSRRVLATCDHL